MTSPTGSALGAWLTASLLVWLIAQVSLAAGLARRSWWRGAIALLMPPLALAWGWNAGMRARAYAWGIALVAYAIGVAAAV